MSTDSSDSDVRTRLLAGARPRLAKIHEAQVHRDPWPVFDAFDRSAYPEALRERSARQWMRRAREEHGSVYEFSTVARGVCDARGGVELLGALSRLITDEVRHAEMCARMGVACWPEGLERRDGVFDWPEPRLPWPEPPARDAEGGEQLRRWIAEAILTSCCIGETISRPLFDAAATVCTDPVCESVLRQILRDEHLHATFGWEALADLLPRLSSDSRAWLEDRLAIRLASFERTSASGLSLSDLADTEIAIEEGDPAEPNLAFLTQHQYAMIFYSTVESEVLPGFAELGFDATAAWARRPRATRASHD